MNEKKRLLVDFDMNKEYNTVRTTSSKYPSRPTRVSVIGDASPRAHSFSS